MERVNQSRFLNFFIGTILIVLGGTVILGWVTRQVSLVQIIPNFPPMVFNTALSFVLTGFAIVFSIPRPKIASFIGIAIFTFSALIWLQYVFVVNFGIDELLMKAYVVVQTPYPGRMAPNTALCFMIIGFIYFSRPFIGKWRLFQNLELILILMVFIMGLMSLLGYWGHLTSNYSWGLFSGMALLTSLGFIITLIPSLTQIFRQIKISIRQSTYFFSIFVFFMCLSFFLILSQVIFSQSESNFSERLKVQAKIISENINTVFKEDIRSLGRLFFRLQAKSYRTLALEKKDIRQYLEDIGWLQAVGQRAGATNFNFILMKQDSDIQKVKNSLEICLSRKLPRASGFSVGVEQDFICVQDPASKSVALIRIDKLIAYFLNPEFFQKYYLEIVSEDGPLYQSEKGFIHENAYFSYSYHFSFFGKPATLYLANKSFDYGEIYGTLTWVFLFLGAILSFLISAFAWYWQKDHLTRQELSEALEEKKSSEELLRNIVRSSLGAILIVNSKDQLIFFNEKAEKLWGYTPQELKNKSIGDLMPEAFREAHAVFRRKFYQNPKFYSLGSRDDQCILNKQGEIIPVEIELSPMIIHNELQILCTFLDVSERRRNQEKIKKMMEDLKRSNEALDDFAYIASHDLKEPLRGISNFSSFLLEDYGDKLEEDGKGQLKTLQNLAKRMINLIDTLLIYSRVGSLDLKLKPTSIRQLIEEKLELLDNFLKENNVEVVLHENLPTLVCDQARMGEVFQNLITNAVKYNTNDRKRVEISCKEEKDEYIFKVKDNGIGIAKEHFDQIFKIFKRLHGRNEFGGGTGAGMTIVRKIVERHAGKIWLESELGQGTTFYFSIPKSRQKGVEKNVE